MANQVPYKPWQSMSEALVDQALQSAISDPETIRSIRPTTAPYLFPETRGMGKSSPTIYDILNIDRVVPTRRSWISGAPVMFRNGFMEDNFSGTSRYSMQGLWG
jgi:hypothetical protein